MRKTTGGRSPIPPCGPIRSHLGLRRTFEVIDQRMQERVHDRFRGAPDEHRVSPLAQPPPAPVANRNNEPRPVPPRGSPLASRRSVWWSSLRLDSTPLSNSESAGKEGVENCQEWGPQSIVGHSGLLAKALILSAIPAFFLGQLIASELGRLGVSEVLTFMVLMPLLIGGWFYFLGRLIDSWGRKRQAASR